MLSRRTDMFVRAHTCLLDGESVSCNLTSNMDTPELSTLKSSEVLRFPLPSLPLSLYMFIPSSLPCLVFSSLPSFLLWCNAITSANFTNPTKYEDVAEILDYNLTTEVEWKRGAGEDGAMWHEGSKARQACINSGQWLETSLSIAFQSYEHYLIPFYRQRSLLSPTLLPSSLPPFSPSHITRIHVAFHYRLRSVEHLSALVCNHFESTCFKYAEKVFLFFSVVVHSCAWHNLYIGEVL